MAKIRSLTKPTTVGWHSLFFLVSGAVMLGTVGVASALLNQLKPTAPLMITFLRLGFSALFLLPMAGLTSNGKYLKLRWQNLPLLAAMGLAMAACQSLFFLAIPLSNVTLVVVISLCSAPVIVAVLSIVLFSEPITMGVTISILLAITGTIALLVGTNDGSNIFKLEYLWGAILALASGLAYSSFMLLSKLATKQVASSSLQTVALAFTVATFILLPLVLITGSWQIELNWQGWLLALYMGLVPTALAYYFIQLALVRASATSAAIVTLLEPGVAALLAWLLLGESITLLTLVGMGLLIFSVLLLARKAK